MKRTRHKHRVNGVNARLRARNEDALSTTLREAADVVIEDYAPADQPLAALARFDSPEERRRRNAVAA